MAASQAYQNGQDKADSSQSTQGLAPLSQLATKAARKCAPSKGFNPSSFTSSSDEEDSRPSKGVKRRKLDFSTEDEDDSQSDSKPPKLERDGKKHAEPIQKVLDGLDEFSKAREGLVDLDIKKLRDYIDQVHSFVDKQGLFKSKFVHPALGIPQLIL